MIRIKSKFFIVLASSVIVLCACGNIENINTDTENNKTENLIRSKREKVVYSGESSIVFDENVTISGYGISMEGDVIYITKGGTFSMSGKMSGCSINIKTTPDEQVTLKLDNLILTGSINPVITCENAKSLQISLEEDSLNSFSESENDNSESSLNSEKQENEWDAFIISNCPVEIDGNGTISVKTKDKGRFKNAFKINGGIFVKESALYIDSPGIDSIILKGDFNCENGRVTITDSKNGISGYNYYFEKGSVEINSENEDFISYVYEFDEAG